jgi:signal transduction histidine kinase
MVGSAADLPPVLKVPLTRSKLSGLGSLSSSYRDAVSTVALTWALAAVILVSLVILLRGMFAPGPAYGREMVLLLAISGASYFWRAKLSPGARSALAAGVFFVAGASSLIKSGPTSHSPFFLTMGVTLLGVCFGMRAWAWGCAAVTAFVAAVGVSATAGWLQPQFAVPDFLRTPVEYVVVALFVNLMSVLLLQVVIALIDQLNVKGAELGERVKELTALHATSRLLQQDRPVDTGLLAELVALLPPAWQYPEICEAHIIVGDLEAATPRWRTTPWMQSAGVAIGSGSAGRIEVAYLEDRPAAVEGPFLAEERSLIQSLADMLSAHLERVRNDGVLREAHARHERQEAALSRLARHYVEQPGDVDAMLRDVVGAVADALRVGRATVWRFGPGRARLTCRQVLDRRNGAARVNVELTREQHPEYFQALESSDSVDAHDALTDPRTRELAETYLRLLGITSLLDVPIGGPGQAQGALGAEHVEGPRRWQPDEQTFLVAVANLVSALLAQIDRQAMELQLRQAQKMEAIGTLAGGIAHDFNNILSAINGYTELAQMDVGNDEAVREHLEAVAQGGARAERLVRQILTFSRRQDQERVPTDLGAVVVEALALLKATLPASITIVTDIPGTLPPVLADPTEVHQVVMNLCTNAWHAMQDRPGRLDVRLDAVAADADFVEAHPVLAMGDYVRLAISDTGHGMDEATIARIFEPFFTTKGPQAGTGLGLSVVHGIIQSYGGAITVYSQPDEGTTFHLYFPAGEPGEVDAPEPPAALPRGDGRRVLIVDDEAPLAHMGRKMLERLGYEVAIATSPAEALEAFRADSGRFDLVVTDLTMPGRSGIDLAADMIGIRPDVRVVLVTGYTATLTPERVQRLGIRELALKPLTLERLATLAERVIAG